MAKKKRKLTKAHIAAMQAGRKKARRKKKSSKKTSKKSAIMLGTIRNATVIVKKG